MSWCVAHMCVGCGWVGEKNWSLLCYPKMVLIQCVLQSRHVLWTTSTDEELFLRSIVTAHIYCATHIYIILYNRIYCRYYVNLYLNIWGPSYQQWLLLLRSQTLLPPRFQWFCVWFQHLQPLQCSSGNMLQPRKFSHFEPKKSWSWFSCFRFDFSGISIW